MTTKMMFCLQKETEKGYIQMKAKNGGYTDVAKMALRFDKLAKAEIMRDHYNAIEDTSWEVAEL
jgi:hypothetical protein